MVFGLITEGPTDQTVLRYIMSKFFADPDIDIRSVQPNADSTDKADEDGGWGRVRNYCKSADMLATLEANDYVVIQMDTDVCEDFGVKKREGDRDLTAEEIIDKTKDIITSYIGTGINEKYSAKIIFAISHDSIECWLLPLYYTNNNRTKTLNCCEVLNRELMKGDFTLDCNSKQNKFYTRIFRDKKDLLRNRKQIENMAVFNSSFQQFVSQLALIAPL